jgi:stage V sporulation protein S
MSERVEILKIAADSSAKSVAGALASLIRTRGTATLEAVGARAINQAVKAIAIARTFLKRANIDLMCVPSLVRIPEAECRERTAVILRVRGRELRR